MDAGTDYRGYYMAICQALTIVYIDSYPRTYYAIWLSPYINDGLSFGAQFSVCPKEFIIPGAPRNSNKGDDAANAFYEILI